MWFNNEILSHLLVTLIYFLLVSVLRFRLDISLIGLWIGALLGTYFLDIDHLFYWFFYSPEKEDSIKARGIWQKQKIGGIREMLKLLIDNHVYHHRLYFHTAVFQVVLFLLSVYVLTSGGNIFASAFVMSMNLHLLKDEWGVYLKKDREGLADWLFWQIKLDDPKKNLEIYLLAVNIFFLGLTFFIFI